MVVFAVMRGTQLVALYSTQEKATEVADSINAEFKRGSRAKIVEMIVR